MQSPGPFLAGMEPRYQAASREEVLGEPLTREEIAELVKGNLKAKRQLNMGRDGLTHNMLENIHAHWKRKRVCKIRCKGVCTVDMDNVCQQLEEKVGGKVIYRQGGVIFLFRGRNYNFRTRPVFPLMLWKPAAPVYPRLVKTVPDGVTPDEATQMRKRGRQLTPICKLGKNGVYTHLVKEVREAFEACDLVRVDCSGLNKSDCRKIGAKLKDLVPCILVSFEFEHILMWRGNVWRPSLPPSNEDNFDAGSGQYPFTSEEISNKTGVAGIEPSVDAPLELPTSDSVIPSLKVALHGQSVIPDDCGYGDPVQISPVECRKSVQYPDELEASVRPMGSSDEIGELETTRRNTEGLNGQDDAKTGSTSLSYLEGVLLLLKQATGNGRAQVLDENEFVDADVIYQKSVALAKKAPRGPVFKTTRRKSVLPKNEPNKSGRVKKHSVENEVPSNVLEKDDVNRGSRKQRNDLAPEFLSDVVPQGTLRVDELAKLLA